MQICCTSREQSGMICHYTCSTTFGGQLLLAASGPRFGNLKRAHIFRPTSIELPSTRKGPKWRAKVGGWKESLDGGGGEMC
ncbi:hypothetical protein CB1_000389003 [Camelus ferus]|nr:hypothetical protein CB1_000389003 [Camelus ferus]